MKGFKTPIIAGVACLLLSGFSMPDKTYKDPTLSPEERAKDLLSRMTLDEKVTQLQCMWRDKENFLNKEGKFDKEKAKEVLKNGIGELGRLNEDFGPGSIAYVSTLHPREAAELNNAVQKFLVEETRLGIPALVHEEGLHGLQALDATNFPMPIGLASSWNPNLMTEVYTVIAREVRSRGGGEVLAPVVDIVQDPRWGRTEETMGEDPYLVSKMGVAEIKAYQGDGELIDKEHVGATLKHLGVHGRSEGGNNTAPCFIDEHTAREFFFKPFKECIRDASPMNVMVAYPELWGVPCHMNKHLVTDLLRKEWGFKGMVVSDYGGISNLRDIDHATPSLDEAGRLGLMAGVDIELPTVVSYKNLAQMVRDGKISMERIDDAVTHILVEKFRLGLFEDPYVDVERADTLSGCKAHREVAYKAATESMVLLQNNDNMLPLDASKIKTIALIGPNADKCVLGGYSATPRQAITPLQAMRERYGNQMNILYSEGVRIVENDPKMKLFMREVSLDDNKQRIADAVETARQADVIILCLGENEFVHRESTSAFALGDLPTLEFLGGQLELVNAIAALGKPMCAMISSGTTLNLAPVAKQVSAVMQCWYLGQETGYAMVDAIFGKVNPSGKLTISFPRSAGHVPAYYNYKPSSRRGYNLFMDVTPLYPFGFGMSYTTFEYSNLAIDKQTIATDGSAVVTVDIKNTGSREGAEIAQMYITDDYATLPRPVKELKGFNKVWLQPGETKTVNFKITPEELAYYDINNNFQVEPGTFTIQVGPSSAKGDKLKLTVE